ncbi:MAG: hypothetical protein OXI73_16140 [Rhodospirillales bacterium]|nr:hypothetical protein [Rhodospirillales bacterium]
MQTTANRRRRFSGPPRHVTEQAKATEKKAADKKFRKAVKRTTNEKLKEAAARRHLIPQSVVMTRTGPGEYVQIIRFKEADSIEDTISHRAYPPFPIPEDYDFDDIALHDDRTGHLILVDDPDEDEWSS